jgi:hypothetical protein
MTPENAVDQNAPTVWEEASELLSSWVIPLYQDRNTRPCQIGTGFFVRTAGAVFLVSAAHVLRLTKDRRLYYYIDPNTTHSISGQLRISRHSNIDVAVVKLDRQPLPPYRAVDKVPMVESMLLSRALPRTGKHYMVSGFPASKNRANPSNLTVNARVYAYRTESIDGAAYSAAGIDPGLHIGLPLDLRAGFDPRGEPVAFPDPHGMSGSPVWLLYDDAETPRDMFQAVAVAVEYRKPQRLLVATDIWFVMQMLRDAA